jgi:hypothetical protein
MLRRSIMNVNNIVLRRVMSIRALVRPAFVLVTLAECRFTATIPAAPGPTIVGPVVCTPGQPAGLAVSGNWTMAHP